MSSKWKTFSFSFHAYTGTSASHCFFSLFPTYSSANPPAVFLCILWGLAHHGCLVFPLPQSITLRCGLVVTLPSLIRSFLILPRQDVGYPVSLLCCHSSSQRLLGRKYPSQTHRYMHTQHALVHYLFPFFFFLMLPSLPKSFLFLFLSCNVTISRYQRACNPSTITRALLEKGRQRNLFPSSLCFLTVFSLYDGKKRKTKNYYAPRKSIKYCLKKFLLIVLKMFSLIMFKRGYDWG